ncbi:MAG: hypothetical protein ACLGGX_06600 [Bdellovibrionia bacterium]
MYSRIALFLTVSLSLFLGGCSDFLEGKKEEKEVLEISDEKFSCLNNLPEDIRLFSEGRGQTNRIESSVQCLQNALTYFQRRTVGAENDFYTIPELRLFFGKYFLKENNVSPELAQELMKLKSALLGGSPNFLTKAEISRLVYLLGVFKEEVIKINPHVGVLTFHEQHKGISSEKIAAAQGVLEAALIRFLKETEMSKSNYSFQDSKKLFSTLADFISGNKPFNLYLRASHYVPIIESVKQILFGVKADLRSQEDWNISVRTVMKLHQVALRFYYSPNGFNFKSSEDMQDLFKIGDLVIDLLLSSPLMVNKGEIAFSDIDSLIKALKSDGVVNLPLTTDTILESYRVLLAKFLDPDRPEDISHLYVLKRTHLLTLQRELDVMRARQEFFEQSLRNSKNFLEFGENFKKINLERWLRLRDGISVSQKILLRKTWEDTLMLLSSSPRVMFTHTNRFIVGQSLDKTEVSWRGVTQINLMMTLARFLMIGYSNGNSLNLHHSYITELGLTSWYSDFNSLGRELKAFDERSGNAGPRSFKEANFFTFRGSGDQQMSYAESFEFISLLFSGGLGSTAGIQKTLSLEQCEVNERDIFDYRMFNEKCFNESFVRNFASYFNNLPLMVRYFTALSTEDKNSFLSELVLAARISPADGNKIEIADIRTMVMLLHYIESVFAVYDRDGDQVLNRQEVTQAGQRFIGFLREVVPGVSEGNLYDGFYYMVFEGEMPSTWDVISSKVQRWFKVHKTADRRNILKVILALKSKLNSPIESGK